MDIAGLSMAMSQSQIANQASISVVKMAMDSAEAQALQMTEMLEETTKLMEQSVNPHIGGNMDISI